MPSIEEIIHDFYAEMPHPMAPSLKIGEYPTAAKLASVLKFGQGHASPPEIANFWHEFQNLNNLLVSTNKLPLSPEEFTHLAKDMASVSFALHGRPPRMDEIARLRDAHPKDIRDYYHHLPDQDHPTVPAGEMVKSLQAAESFAQHHLGRSANKWEAAQLHHSGEHPDTFYSRMRAGDGVT